MREMVGGCCVCSDDRGWTENPLVYCDGQSCYVAVHQACYGIVTVPTGPWFCCKCESQDKSTKVKCELCPSKYGALKRTDNQGWAHVVCALYIPEVRFGNVSTMEPIQLHLIPAERFNKVCYICEEKGKPANATVGACMQCNRVGCKQQFHVTCAQSLGLLCEEAGNYLDNVKYCGYCQHHYSKLVRIQNILKPVSDNHNSDSNSEKEAEPGTSTKTSPSQAAGKRKSGSGGKTNTTKVSTSSKPTGSSQQKTAHSNNKGSGDKRASSSKTGKAEETLTSASSASEKSDKKDNRSDSVSESDKESKDKDTKSVKRRKGSSRTPTPVQSEVSVVVSAGLAADVIVPTTSAQLLTQTDKKNCASTIENTADKLKRIKLDTTQLIISNQPVVALTSISTTKISSPCTITTSDSTAQSEAAPAAVPTPSIIQIAQAQSHQPHQSLVVSVPLANTSLSPHHPLVANPANPLTVMPFAVAATEKNSVNTPEKNSSVTPILSDNVIMPSNNSSQGLLSSEMSGGGLKITFEKQPDSINTEVDMELELDTPSTIQEVPSAKRTRSQSHEKTDRTTRGKKRNSTGNSTNNPQNLATSSLPATMPKRSIRSQQSASPPVILSQQQQHQPGAFAAISQEKIKDSPPSSPSSESQGPSSNTQNIGRMKGRKSAPAAVNVIQTLSKEDKKEVKMFQNGVTTAPHMLGNQLNPTSNMHQKMTDHLSNELEAHSIYNNSNDASQNLMGPQLHHRIVQSTRASSTGSSTASGGSGLSSMLGGGGGAIPQTLDQLLERQWEQGSQFLMEQAQHFDIASLLSCLHQLRAENVRLEDHVSSLLQRRDHLLAVNARLAIPLTGQPAAAPPQSSHTVNNIHPSIPVSHSDITRSRHSTGSYDRYPQSSLPVPVENGLLPDAYAPNSHRDSVGSGQPSPNVRHSPAAIYSNNGLLRQCADIGGRSAPPRAQPYPVYERPGSSHSTSSQQMVIRREREREQDIFGHSSQPS
uniref:PHD-type domain-containing protein n=1 Tax=Dendroctonus ponderosae TaxID=77166 RepID=A0AAR5P8A4_DENPD